MKPIRRILVAVKEPTARNLPAVNKAAQLAKGLGAQLTLFHDIATPVYVETIQTKAANLKAYQQRVQERTHEQLEAIAVRVRRHGVDVDTAADWDFPPSEAIIRKAMRISADLVVVQNHHSRKGRHPARWLLAYTDWELLRLCPAPVLLVKGPRLYHRPRVLAAIDPSHAHAKPANLDKQILRAGAQLVHALRGELHAVHAYSAPPPIVTTLPDAPLIGLAEQHEGVQKRARADLARAVDGFDVKRSHCHLVEGRPADVIPEQARRTRSAIVAMGAISRSGLKRFFIGNTAEAVMDEVTADLLVVKPANFTTSVPLAGRGMQVLAMPLLAG